METLLLAAIMALDTVKNALFAFVFLLGPMTLAASLSYYIVRHIRDEVVRLWRYSSIALLIVASLYIIIPDTRQALFIVDSYANMHNEQVFSDGFIQSIHRLMRYRGM